MVARLPGSSGASFAEPLQYGLGRIHPHCRFHNWAFSAMVVDSLHTISAHVPDCGVDAGSLKEATCAVLSRLHADPHHPGKAFLAILLPTLLFRRPDHHGAGLGRRLAAGPLGLPVEFVW